MQKLEFTMIQANIKPLFSYCLYNYTMLSIVNIFPQYCISENSIPCNLTVSQLYNENSFEYVTDRILIVVNKQLAYSDQPNILCNHCACIQSVNLSLELVIILHLTVRSDLQFVDFCVLSVSNDTSRLQVNGIQCLYLYYNYVTSTIIM